MRSSSVAGFGKCEVALSRIAQTQWEKSMCNFTHTCHSDAVYEYSPFKTTSRAATFPQGTSAIQSFSASSRHRLQPSPRHIHPPTRAWRQLFKCPQRRIQIVRRTSGTPIHHLQVHAPLRFNIRIVPRCPQHLVAQRVVIAIPTLAGRGARGVEDNVRDGDDVVAIAARLSACAEARAVVSQVAGEGLGVGGEREVLVVSTLVVRFGVEAKPAQAYFDRAERPAARPMISARRASIAASSAIKKTFRLSPRYRLCGGRKESSLLLSPALAGALAL